MTGMARRRVGSTLALAAALATVLFSVRARADTMVHLSGDATPGGPEHFWVPFDVPAGTKEIQIAHDDHSPDDILDWGVYDEKGAFRGYGGGNVEDAVIGELASSRSYLVGPIAAGTWKVDVGKAKIASAKVSWTIDVTFRSAPTLAPQPLRAPYAPQPALKKEARWYQGDFHAHSIESGDAKPPIPDMIAFAKTRGLDFIELSDHNTTSQLDFYQQYRDGQVLLIPGVEYTTYAGHANGIGATKWVDHKIGTDGATILGGVQSIHAQGALFSINHPVLELGDLCIGCAWKHDVPPEQIDAVEIETGGWRQVGVLFQQVAQHDLRVDVTGFVAIETFQILALELRRVVVRPFVHPQGTDLGVGVFVFGKGFAGVFDIEILGADFFTLDPCFPVVGAFFPKNTFLFVAPAFADVADGVVFAHFAAERQHADFLSLFFDRVTAQFYVYFPVFDVETFVVK